MLPMKDFYSTFIVLVVLLYKPVNKACGKNLVWLKMKHEWRVCFKSISKLSIMGYFSCFSSQKLTKCFQKWQSVSCSSLEIDFVGYRYLLGSLRVTVKMASSFPLPFLRLLSVIYFCWEIKNTKFFFIKKLIFCFFINWKILLLQAKALHILKTYANFIDPLWVSKDNNISTNSASASLQESIMPSPIAKLSWSFDWQFVPIVCQFFRFGCWPQLSAAYISLWNACFLGVIQDGPVKRTRRLMKTWFPRKTLRQHLSFDLSLTLDGIKHRASGIKTKFIQL